MSRSVGVTTNIAGHCANELLTGNVYVSAIHLDGAVTSETWPSIVGRANLAGLGLSTYRLYAMAAAGELEQIAAGLYARPGAVDDTTAAWASISLRKPAATICLLSALSMHD